MEINRLASYINSHMSFFQVQFNPLGLNIEYPKNIGAFDGPKMNRFFMDELGPFPVKVKVQKISYSAIGAYKTQQ